MTRRLVLGAAAVVALVLFAVCRRDARDPSARARELEDAADDYRPSALEVPLPADFAKAAEKRVQEDNYKKELTRIERELKALKALR